MLYRAIQEEGKLSEVQTQTPTSHNLQLFYEPLQDDSEDIHLCFLPVRTSAGVRVIRLPAASCPSFVLRFLETMCRHLQCDNLFSSQPFSRCTSYDRNKSGNVCLACCWTMWNRRNKLHLSAAKSEGDVNTFFLCPVFQWRRKHSMLPLLSGAVNTACQESFHHTQLLCLLNIYVLRLTRQKVHCTKNTVFMLAMHFTQIQKSSTCLCSEVAEQSSEL